MPDARYNVAINFTVTRDGSGFSQMQQELGRIATATEKTAKQGGLRWTELKSQIDLTAGALRTVARVGGQVFEFSREGAQIAQTRESFALMNDEIFKTPDLLERMRDASRGTISDVQLMQGVLKLTAGTSDELGRAMAQNAPQLLEIAKASNKLNPSLGDTAFLYDSISTGIKRASPLILDNLGIVVKVGEANKTYAEQLGKSVAALTAEEKQMALLNATMEAGDKLIKQVGGNVDAQADAWARLEVKVSNATDELKEFAAEALLPVIEGVSQSADAITNEYGQSVEGMIASNIRAADSLEDVRRQAARLEEAYGIGGGLGALITGTTGEIEQGIRDTATAMEAFAGSQGEFNALIEESFGSRSRNVIALWAQELNISSDELFQFLRNLRLAGESADADRKFFLQTAEAIEDIGDASADSASETREWTRAQIDGLQALRDGLPPIIDYETSIQRLRDAHVSGRIATDEYIDAQFALHARLNELRPAIDAAKNDILGINESLGLATGRAAFEIFVDATQAQQDIEGFQQELDGLEDFHKTTVELDADQATEEAQAFADELIKSADQFEAIITSNAEEEITPAERLNQEYDKAERDVLTHFETNADQVLELQVTPLQDAYGENPEELTTEFFTPGLDEALDDTSRWNDLLKGLPRNVTTDYTINVKVNQTGGANVPGGIPDEFRAHGGRFIVPPGYNEKVNPYIVAVESGEEVIVRTASDRQRASGIQSSGGSSAGFVDRSNITIINENSQAAAVALGWIDRTREKRLNRWME